MCSSRYFKIISRILILAMLHLCWLTSYGWAEMVPTESAVQSQSETDRQRLLDLLNRQEVIEELEKYGISKVEAVARINSLTDEEITVIAGKLDKLPPGGVVKEFVFILAVPFTVIYGILCYFTKMIWRIITFKTYDTAAEKVQEFEERMSTCFKPFGDTLRIIKGGEHNNSSLIEDDSEKEINDPNVSSLPEDCDPGMESCT